MKPLAIDLFCGLGGWAEGFLVEGYDVVGFDIERHDYGRGGYPGQLVLQDALTLDGSQFRNAACIVASPPCQEYSYMAMPWKLAKAKAAAIRADETGEALRKLRALFDACFRIQREAIAATAIDCPACFGLGPRHPGHVCPRCDGKAYVTRYIPMVVENVKGAQPWVGPAKAHFGSFYLWGDVAMVGNRVVSSVPVFGRWTRSEKRVQKFNPDGTEHPQGSWFKIADSKDRGANAARKVEGFNFHEHEKTGKPGRSFQSAAVANGVKLKDSDGYERHHPEAFGWKSPRTSSGATSARKAASAEIAKIPFGLASYIARTYNTL